MFVLLRHTQIRILMHQPNIQSSAGAKQEKGKRQTVTPYIKILRYTALLLHIVYSPCQVGLVMSLSASHMVGRCNWFASRPGHTKDHHKNGTKCLPALHACVRVGV